MKLKPSRAIMLTGHFGKNSKEFQGRLWRPRPGCKATEHCAWDMVTLLGRVYGAAIRPKGYPRQTFQEGSVTREYKRSGSSPRKALCAASWCYAWSTLPGTPIDKKAAWRTERERMGWPWMTWRRQSHRKSQITETLAWKAAGHAG